MKNKTKFLSMIFILIISLSATASAREITVDDDYGTNYTSIQEAVDNSTTGDTIIVRPGIYTENVVVNTTGLIIKSESDNSDAQVKPLNESVSTFLIEADNTTISGLNITGSGVDSGNCAILVYSNMNNLTGNTIENGCIILFSESTDNLITENEILNSGDIYGIDISCCGLNTNVVSDNVISNCSTGIHEYDQGADIRNNTITDCNCGIELNTSSSGIDNNKILNCDVGILLGEGSSPTIVNNTIMSCAECGIYDMDGNSSKLIYNNYFNNTLNVRFGAGAGGSTWNSSLTTGTNIVGGPYTGGNFWANPNGTGFSQTCADLDGNGIGDLSYNISENDYDYLPLVYYTSPQNPVIPSADFTTNVSSGYVPLTVQFTDLSQNATGWSWNFGDGNTSDVRNTTHTYSAAGNHTVTLTASNVNGTATKTAIISVMQQQGGNGSTILPDASFTTNVTSGYYPLTVLFTDTSQNSTSRSWDVNGDGVADSTDASFAYTYGSSGDYTATLTARNANGTDTASAMISVERRSSGGSSGGGGGGGGGSPEPAKNVQVKELAQTFVTNGKAVQFDFTKNATCVVYVNFDSKKTAGKTTTIAEQLKNKSTLTSGLPDGEVYRYFNVWVGNSGFATSSNIDNPGICFKVEKSWLQDKKVDKNSITLNRYSNKSWGELPVSLLKEDSKYLYFTADVSGYSFFAITGKSSASSGETVIKPQNESENTANNTGDTGSEADTEPATEENKGAPGFGMICGIVGLSAAFMYRRK